MRATASLSTGSGADFADGAGERSNTVGRGFLMYGLIGAGFASAGSDDADGSGAGVGSLDGAGFAGSPTIFGVAGDGGGSRLSSVLVPGPRDVGGFDALSGAAAFLMVPGSAVKTWPHREHLKVGLSAGRTRSSMRYRV
jgi:hypothetical protein